MNKQHKNSKYAPAITLHLRYSDRQQQEFETETQEYKFAREFWKLIPAPAVAWHKALVTLT